MPLRIYISHASEDQARVNQLRDTLRAQQHQVFLCEDLPPGADWQKEIDQELKRADVFLYCLSLASVARLGQYNDELKAARARRRTEGEHAISIVPLRFEACMIPAEVSDLMALDLFAADGLKRLLALLQSRVQAPSGYVFLLHGIKTRGKWQKDVSPLLSASGLIPVPLDFDNFGAYQLIWPPARKRKLQWLLDEYTRECDRLKCTSPSLVAHSFGSYLAAGLLKKYSRVSFDRVILCGSIVHPDFPWPGIAANGQVTSVLNQYGGEDFWARVVQWVVKDAGPSGHSGFSQPGTVVEQQRNVQFEHSDYFYDLNYRRNWIPFLSGYSLPSVSTSVDGWRAPVNWRFRSVLALVVVICVAGALLVTSHVRPKSTQTTESQPFSGFVQNDQGDPLQGVTITAPMLNVPTQETDLNGRFSFQVHLPAGTNFRLIAQKPGFETYTADPPAGDTTFNISLHSASAKKQP